MMPWTKCWLCVLAFAVFGAFWIGVLVMLNGCSPAQWRDAARGLLTVSDVACAVVNAWRPDEDAMRACNISEPLREDFRRQLQGSRVGLAGVQRAGVCWAPDGGSR